jgi:hypothetical protein
VAAKARREKVEVMKNVLALSLVGLLAIAGGCKQKDAAVAETSTTAATTAGTTTTNAAEQLTPEELGELGAQIRKSPDKARELLSEHGLDEKSFESQIRKVTEDPDASKRYAEAYKKASS